jgi:hypothetical protein
VQPVKPVEEQALDASWEEPPVFDGFGHAYVNLGLLLHRAKNDVMEARAVWQNLLAIDPEHDVAAKARELLQETAALVN